LALAQAEPAQVADARRQLRALRIAEAIHIDGRLNEPAWSQAEPATGLLQQDPREGAPASERTEIRILFDERNLYVGIRAWDSDIARINARELTRDADFANDDKIEVLLDTFRDRRNAYRFAVNPHGTQQDALVSDNGRSVNLDWNAPWVSDAQRDDQGWTVELAIPLSNLRFREGQDSWGINFARIIRRKNEESLWTSWRRALGLERVSEAGDLTGMSSLRRRRLFEVKPYGTAGWRQNVARVGFAASDTGIFGSGGIEVAKLGLTPSLTAEFTVNPDFGQTEVDEQVINLTRFSVFLPEKREFFLENAGVFLIGRERITQLFFTRRIGLTDNGQPVPLDYGAKITGRAGPYSLGFLQVQTRARGEGVTTVPRQQFTVARVKRDVLGSSYIGAMYAGREGGPAYHRSAGLDGQLRLSEYWLNSAFLMATFAPGATSRNYAGRVQTQYDSDRFGFTALYENIGERFDPQLGFAERTGVRQYFGEASWKPRPRFLPFVRQMEFESRFEYYEDQQGRLETRELEFSWETRFQNSSELQLTLLEDTTDVLRQPFEIRPGIVIPPGAYGFNRHGVSYESDTSRRLRFAAGYEWGDFFSGARQEVSTRLIFRPNPHLLLDAENSFNRVRLPQGEFSTNLLRGRARYNFSRKVLTSVLLQFNSAARVSSVNARFRYIFRPNSDLFVIYTQNTGRGLDQPSYQFQVKTTYHWGR
jgi:hypothetical protein